MPKTMIVFLSVFVICFFTIAIFISVLAAALFSGLLGIVVGIIGVAIFMTERFGK